MIIHKLIPSMLRIQRRGGKDDKEFYLMQALDSIEWLKKKGVKLGKGVEVLDLGCGFGIIGGELAKEGCEVTLSDDDSFVRPEYQHLPFRRFDICKDRYSDLGQYDLVAFSNVFEHLPNPETFLSSMADILKPNGLLYMSWTNWLSIYGGHEYAPFHYLGPRLGVKLRKALLKGHCQHVLYENLFPTYIGPTVARIRRDPRLRIVSMAPRYYPEFAFIAHIPLVREFLTWNCVILIQRVPEGPSGGSTA